jgi:hypothetical protein
MKALYTLLLVFVSVIFSQAQNVIVKGVVKNSKGNPIKEVTVLIDEIGTTTNNEGYYEIKIPAHKKSKVTIKFSHISYFDFSKRITVQKGKTINFSPKLVNRTEDLKEVVINSKKKLDEQRTAKGVEKIDEKEIKNLPSINGEISSIIKNKSLGATHAAGEESSTYNVRGGNYDENLVYVNGIEVYRPFLVRSGQQEGLSFVNVSMTKNVEFSSGGFQAKFGDKLSSVLDITYRMPKESALQFNGSLLGASLTYEDKLLKNKKLSVLIGARYRNNSLIVDAKDVESNYKPSFADVQSYMIYDVNKKLKFSFLGNFSLNKYDFKPFRRITNFGTVSDPKALVVHFNGQEKDRYFTLFSALSAEYKFSDKLNFQVTTSLYNTKEEEHFDIEAFYGIGDVNADFGGDDFGNVEFTQSIGSQLNHARNDLDALIFNTSVKGTYKLSKDLLKDLFEFGVKYQKEDIRDRIIEWEVIDSAGFSIRPDYLTNNDEPYTVYTGPIVPFSNIRAKNFVTIDRITAFSQWSRESYIAQDTKYWLNVGVRAHQWRVTDDITSNSESQIVFSPRVQFAIKPEGWNRDMLFRLATGFYYQPPFYKELRDINGMVHPKVKAQKSIHFVLANEYNFKLWERPFKLVSEAYYKTIHDVNPFTVENVQIRYAANNNAKAYAFGFDSRIGGEFVPGTESYFTVGYLKTKENINNKGYIYRPTDQRLKFAILYQDYMPNNKNFKMYLNMVYYTGVPGGSPKGADPYEFQFRLKDYFRSDIGVSYVFVDSQKKTNSNWLKHFKEFSVGLELYNMFEVQNSITNTWVRDVSSKRSYAIPNYLSGRILNFKMHVKI